MNNNIEREECETKFPWPKRGNVPLKAGGRTHMSAPLNYRPRDWYPYIEGYRRAAECLVEKVRNCHYEAEFLARPICFMYRHYIELQLKDLINDAKRLLDDKVKLKSTHNIDALWKECRSLLERIWPETKKNDLDVVESYITQYSKIDPSSFSFRYPVNRENQPTLSDLPEVDLENLSKVMEELSGFFWGCDGALQAERDAKNDMLSEYAQNVDFM